MNLLKKYLTSYSFWIFIAVMMVSSISHAYNMFHYPYFENDEGAYLSQAWSVINLAKLSPYTYWYDHAPGGWIFMALWIKLTGGFFTFGYSFFTGRVFMLVLHLFSSALVYFSVKKLSRSDVAAAIAVLVFSLSPLAIYFQRRVLLDNIMVFWVLLSFALLLVEKLKLRHIVLSAITFGFAVLTKENAIFFLPAFLYLVYIKSHVHHRSFAVAKWLVVSGLVVSLYFLYALLKNEFFPVGFMGDMTPRVSLLTTLSEQYSRGGGYAIWDPRSDIYRNFLQWFYRDSFVITVGFASFFACLILAIWKPAYRIVSVFTIFFVVFLFRGGLVIDFYVIPLIPFFAMCIGMTFQYIVSCLSFKNKYVYFGLSILLILFAVGLMFVKKPIHFLYDETTPQIEAYEWINHNVSKDSVIVTDAFSEVEFRENGYSRAIWFWKVWSDGAEKKKFDDNWENIDYLFLSHEALKQITERGDADILQKFLDNSVVVASFGPNDPETFVDVEKHITTNGDWVKIYKRKTREDMVLDNSWKYYKENFIHSYGQVIDPSNDVTTSEGQSYAMLRAVIQGDRDTFDGVWAWTRDHLQHREDDMLLSWKWGREEGLDKVLDSANATDADEDIAFALILASQTWGDKKYSEEAKIILNDIWENCVVEINGRYYLLAGAEFSRPGGYVVNPSYLSPAMYKVFADVDPNHPWKQLANDSYEFLDELSAQNNTGLVSNWVLVTPGGAVRSASPYIQEESDEYGFNAFRTHWRVALDYQLFQDARAKKYLLLSSKFFEDEWKKNGSFAAVYNLDGTVDKDYASLSTSVGPLSVFSVTNPQIGEEVYSRVFESSYDDKGCWGDFDNYYNQNWAWLGMLLYSKKFEVYQKYLDKINN